MNRRSFLQVFGVGGAGCATLKAKKLKPPETKLHTNELIAVLREPRYLFVPFKDAEKFSSIGWTYIQSGKSKHPVFYNDCYMMCHH